MHLLHGLSYGEIVPVALPIGELLLALFPLLLWGVAIGLLIAWRHTIGAAFAHLANLLDAVSIPVVFKRVHPLHFAATGLRNADHAIQQALHDTAIKAEYSATYLFHHAMAAFQWLGHELWNLAQDTANAFLHLINKVIPRVIDTALYKPLFQLRQLVTRLDRVEHNLIRTLTGRLGRLETTLEHDFGIARRGIDVLNRDFARVERQITALARSGIDVLTRDLDLARADITRLRNRVGRLEQALTEAALLTAVTAALGTIGLGFLRCPSFLRLGSRIGCAGFGLLEDLLFGAIEAFAVLDMCDFAAAITVIAEEMRPMLYDFVDVEQALVGCHGATAPPALSLPALQLPPANAGLRLAA